MKSIIFDEAANWYHK